jgi:hypothetical protein
MKTDRTLSTELERSDSPGANYLGNTVVDTGAIAVEPCPVKANHPAAVGGPFPMENWGLVWCGFQPGREFLDARFNAGLDPDPGPIAVIDVGNGALDHPSIKPVVKDVYGHVDDLSSAVHAAEVTGVIVSACPARVDVYNVATSAGLQVNLILDALRRVLASNVRVLNLSVGWHERETELNAKIKECLEKGIVVVAAMGESEEPSEIVSYPAAIAGVIAVGATDLHDRRLPGSSVGDHIWIAAPGEDIPTTTASGEFGLRQGTSFATALVSAAAWLAVRAHPDWTPQQVRQALGDSADSTLVAPVPPNIRPKAPANGKWNVAVGCGRLDVARLATLATRV